MNGLAVLDFSDMHIVNRGAGNGDREQGAATYAVTETLEQLALKLLVTARSVHQVAIVDVRSGVYFYDEVRRFESDLIQRALVFTSGSQVRAARLLNMKVTTHNSEIQHYDINVDLLVGSVVALEAGGSDQSEG